MGRYTSQVTVCLALLLGLASLPPLALAGEASEATGTSLEAFYAAALNFSPALQIARERLNVNAAREDAALALLLPELNASANVSENDRTNLSAVANGTRHYSGERYALQLRQVLFDWQRFAARSRAAAQVDQAEAEYHAQLAALLADVADKYFQVLEAEDVLRSLAAQLDALSSQVEQLQAMYERQLVRVTDLLDAQARLAAAQAERVAAESDLSLKRNALRSLSNLEVGSLGQLQAETAPLPLDGSLEYWITSALEHNSLLEARSHAQQAADQQVSASRGAFLPNVSFVMQQQRSNLGFDNQPIDAFDLFYVGIDVNLPLFAGGRSRAGLREAEGLRAIARHELRQAQLETVESVRSAYLQARGWEARIEAAQLLLDSTNTTYSAMQRGFELGTTSNVELLNALRDRFEAERAWQQARYGYLRTSLALRRDSGVLSVADLMALGQLLE